MREESTIDALTTGDAKLANYIKLKELGLSVAMLEKLSAEKQQDLLVHLFMLLEKRKT